MITPEDIQVLASVFATKDDMAKLASKEDVSFMRTNLNDLTQQGKIIEENVGRLKADLNTIKKDTGETTVILRDFIDQVNEDALKKSATINERLDKIDALNKRLVAKLGLSMQ